MSNTEEPVADAVRLAALATAVVADWPGEDLVTVGRSIASFAAAIAPRSLFTIPRGAVEAYVLSLPAGERIDVRRILVRALETARRRGDREGIDGEKIDVDGVLAREPVARDLALRVIGRSGPRRRREVLRIVATYCMAARAVYADPVGALPTMVAGHLAAIERTGRDPRKTQSVLRAFFDAAIAAGLRTVHPLPREVERSAAEGSPYSAYVRVAIRAYAPSNRRGASSLLSLHLARVAAAGLDPLDLTFAQLERVCGDEDTLRRTRGPVLRFLEAAEAMEREERETARRRGRTPPKGRIGAAGRVLLRSLRLMSTSGRWRHADPYLTYARSIGYPDPGTVPVIERERYLSQLDAALRGEGVPDAERRSVRTAARARIRIYEARARAAGLRAERSRRLERVDTHAAVLGVRPEESDRFLALVVAGLRPSVHRWTHLVVTRFVAHCLGHGIDPIEADDAAARRFLVEAGDHLGLTPVRRAGAALAAMGLRTFSAPVLVPSPAIAAAIARAAAAE